MMHMWKTGQFSEVGFLLQFWAPRIKLSSLTCWAISPTLCFVYFQTEYLVVQTDLKLTMFFSLALNSRSLHLCLSAIPCLACIFSLSLNFCSLNIFVFVYTYTYRYTLKHTCSVSHIHCCCCCSSFMWLGVLWMSWTCGLNSWY